MFNYVNNFQATRPGERDYAGVDVVGHMNLAQNEFTSGVRRPFLDSRGRPCVVINTGETELVKGERVPIRRKRFIADLAARGMFHPVWNTTSLSVRDWIHLDDVVTTERRKQLTVWADLVRMSPHPAFNGWTKTTVEYEAMNDPGHAIVDMDGRGDGIGDSFKIDLRSVPLPITHTNFCYGKRFLDIANAGRMPLSRATAEAAGRRNGETVEQTALGTLTGMTYGTQSSGYGTHTGTSTVFGLTNFTYRVTKTDLHSPSASSPEQVVEDFIEMVEVMRLNNFRGPYMVYTSIGYDRFLEDDYFRTGGTSAVRTLRERLLAIKDIIDIKRVDYLTSGYQVIMVQVDNQVVEAIQGMPPTVLQWDSLGGLELNFKYMEISVPMFKAPYTTSTSGVLHATTS